MNMNQAKNLNKISSGSQHPQIQSVNYMNPNQEIALSSNTIDIPE